MQHIKSDSDNKSGVRRGNRFRNESDNMLDDLKLQFEYQAGSRGVQTFETVDEREMVRCTVFTY